MSYNNYSVDHGSYQQGRRNYGRPAPFNQNYKPKKHSGCKTGLRKDNGKPFIQAWNFQKRRGMLTLIASEYKGTKDHKSKTSGRIWRNWVATLQYKDSGIEKLVGCLYDPQSRKLIIPELGMVANPSKNYFGTFTRKN